MVKETLAILTVWALSFSACSCKGPTHRPAATEPTSLKWQLDAATPQPTRAWTRATRGLVVDLAVAKDGSTVLASTVPDYDSDGGTKKHQILSYTHTGKLNFLKIPKAPVKAQALSNDGSLAFVSTYDDKLSAYGPKGRLLWQVPAICKPVPLNRLKQVICYHDDDAEPGIAFEVLDWRTGQRLSTFPIQGDVLALKVSPDERSLAISLSGGWLEFFSADLKLLWKEKLPAEVLDFSISSGDSPQVAVLTADGKLSLLGSRGALVAITLPSVHVEQLQILPDGAAILAYGNGKPGQAVVGFHLEAGRIQERWVIRDPLASQYNAPLLAAGGSAAVRFENSGGKASDGKVLEFDQNAHVHWSLPLKFGEGHALYDLAPGRLLVLATEDGSLAAFRLLP